MELYINDIQVDLDERIPFPLTYQVSDIRDLSKRKGSASKTITLPGTQTNTKLMSGVFVVSGIDSVSGNSQAFDDFDPTIKAQARYYERGILQFQGICQLRDCIKKEGIWSFEIVLFQESIDIVKLLSNYKIRELGWSEYNHTLNKTNQSNSWSGSIIKNGAAYSNITGTEWNGEGYYYGLIDYGFERPTADTFRVEDLAPQVFVKDIVDKMFTKIGATYDSDFFETQKFKKLLLAYEGGEFPSIDSATATANSIETDWKTDGSGYVLDRDYTGVLQNGIWQFFAGGNNVVNYRSDSATTVDPSGLLQSEFPMKMVIQEGGLYKLTFSGSIDVDLNFTVTGGSGSYDITWNRYAFIQIYKNGQLYQNQIIYSEIAVTSTTLLNTKSVTGTFVFDLQLQPSDIIDVKVVFQNSHRLEDTGGTPTEVTSNLTVSPVIQLDIGLEQVSITEGSTVNVKQFLPEKMTCADFFKGLMTMFNLVVKANEDDPKKLEIEPLDDFYFGTQNSFEADITLDWTKIVDRSKEWRVTPTVNFSDKEYKFLFEDDKDYWNTKYTDSANEQYGSKIDISSSEFATKTNEQKLPFSQKPIVDIPFTDLIVPRSYEVKTQEGGFAQINPKRGKAFICQVLNKDAGTLRTGAWIHQDSVGDTARASYPYVGHIDDPETPTFDLLFNVLDYIFYTLPGGQSYTTNNLYSYHERSIRELIDRQGKLLTCYVKLDAGRINTLDFKRLIKIDGVVYKLNKIENYESGNEDPTKIELIKLIEGSNVKTYGNVGSVSPDPVASSTIIDVSGIPEGDSVQTLGVSSDGTMVKSNTDTGEVLYKARLVQSGTSAPTVTEYINNDGTISSGYTTVGTFTLSGFSDLSSGNIEIEFSLNGESTEEVICYASTNKEITILTSSAGSLANGVLKGSGSTYFYNVITIKKYA